MKRRKRRARYHVGVRKEYFPRELWPTGTQQFSSYAFTFDVLAWTRREAVERVWAQQCLQLMTQMTQHARDSIISLECNEPGMVNSTGRLRPIQVHDGRAQETKR